MPPDEAVTNASLSLSQVSIVSTPSDRDSAVQQCFRALLSKIAALFLVIVT
jgi:hypothetical protein